MKGIEKDSETMDMIRKYYTEPYKKNQKTDPSMSFIVAGNHDYGYKEPSYKTVMRQVNYQYKTSNKRDKTWNMPYRYYILYDQDSKAVFFILDSNVFLWDQVQINWFISHYEIFNENGYKKFLVMHHPALTFGKRMLEDENLLKHWKGFYKDRQAKFKNTDINIIENESVGSQIYKLLIEHNMPVDAIFAAHDHFTDVRLLRAYGRNVTIAKDDTHKTTYQFTSGSAGADKKTHASYQFSSDATVWLGRKFLNGEVAPRKDVTEEIIKNTVDNIPYPARNEKQGEIKEKLGILSDAFLRINEQLNQRNSYFKMNLTSTYCYVDAIDAEKNWLLYRFFIPSNQNTEQVQVLRRKEKIINLILETLTYLRIRAEGMLVGAEQKELYTHKINRIENLVKGFSILEGKSKTPEDLIKRAYDMFNTRTSNLTKTDPTTSALYFRKLCELYNETIPTELEKK